MILLSPPLFSNWKLLSVRGPFGGGGGGPSRPTMFPPTLKVTALQVIATVVTLAVTVPLPVVTVQFCAGEPGCVRIVTEYGLPVATGVANVKAPLAVMVRLSPPLSWRTRPVPTTPVTVPPTVKLATQATVALVTSADAVPDPFVTVHSCGGAVGWVRTVMAYAPVTLLANVKGPFAVTVRLSPPLSCNTKPVPERPETVPLMECGVVPPPPPPPPLLGVCTPLQAETNSEVPNKVARRNRLVIELIESIAPVIFGLSKQSRV